MKIACHMCRGRFWIAVLAITTLSTAAGSAPPPSPQSQQHGAPTTGRLDYGRHILSARMSPYRAIGKLSGAVTCAGAIVLHPRIVLTASHCITGNVRPTRPVSFRPTYAAGSSHQAFEGKVWAMGALQHLDKQSVEEASEDWAIVLLKERPDGIRPLRVQNYTLEQLTSFHDQIVLPRYSFDITRAELLGAGVPCSIRGEAWGVLVHDCTAVPEASGAPLLVEDDVWYAVVGVHSGSMFVESEDGYSLRPAGKSAIRVDRFAGSLRALLRKLDADDASDGLHVPAY